MTRMNKRKINVGDKYGRLTVIKPTNQRMGKFIIYKCICDCGKECYVTSGNLGKSTNSCGCLNREKKTKHNQSQTKLYNTWINMKQRCNNLNNPRYKNYGKRGIRVCDEWYDFQNFYDWAINNGYDENLNKDKKLCTLDRIDNDGNYCPLNCRWITNQKQQNNKTDTVYHTYCGETHTISELAQLYNLPLRLLKSRIQKGWDIKRALEEPFHSENSKKRNK